MRLTRQLTLLLAAVLLLALGGSLVLHTLQARSVLQAQLTLRNADAANALALALSQQRGDDAALRTVAAAHFDLGHYARLTLTAPDGTEVLALVADPPRAAAPGWFQALLPLQAREGRARVSDGWRELGLLRLQAPTAWATEALWQAALRTAALTLALVSLAGLLGAMLLRAWQRPLRDTVAQAQALEEGRFVTVAVPRVPELAQLARTMNQLVARLQQVFAAHAQQLQHLQDQAQRDALTALPRREVFLGRLQEHIAAGPAAPHDAPAPAAGDTLPGCLLLLRVPGLPALNAALGHDATDHLLQAVADMLRTYEERVVGSFAGRLNGSDFVLCLPAPGVAAQTAFSLLGALAATPLVRSAGVELAVGALEGLPAVGASAALAAADAALAEAEAGGATAPQAPDSGAAEPVITLPSQVRLAVHQAGNGVPLAGGAAAWRTQITDALDQGRVQLGSYPVRNPQGGLWQLACPLRVQLLPGGPFHPARRWLALAARSRLLPRVDEAALSLALQAAAADGQSRAVHLSAATLQSSAALAALAQRLHAVPHAAACVWLDLDEAALADGGLPAPVVAWRALGVRLAVAHAGGTPQALAALPAADLDAVKLAARHVHGVATDEAVRRYAGALVELVHRLGLPMVAEGVDSADDLQALWALGYDAATGPAVI
jgi:EAL domain-containing protein (putative c-di-GMP-specific phosphodiesterase class I)/GGDEF domain-containing protein